MSVQQADSVFSKTKVAQLVAQLFVGSLVLGAAMPASAASCTWNTTAGNWNAIANWLTCATGNGNPASTPGAADSAAIGANGAVTINTGQSIFALSNAGTITLDAFGLNLVGGGSTTNTGIINVGGASTANIGVSAGHNINNTGGTINIADGSVVNQFGSTITGGTIATSSAGVLQAFSSGSNFLSGVTLDGVLDMGSIANSRERIANGLTVNGNVFVANGGILSFDSSATSGGNQTIGGTGAINLNDAAARITLEGTGTTTIGSGLTIRGQGTINSAIYVGGAHSLVNNGLISADVAAGTLNIQPPGGTITNNGTLQAQNGGTLLLSSDVINNGGGQIVAGIGSTVRQNGVRISGTINTSGSGSFAAISSASNILDAVTLNGTLDLTSITNSRERVANGITFAPGSVINIANGGILSMDSSLTTLGNQTIGGTGTINLNDAAARITLEGSGVTTVGSGVVIRGQGAINSAIYVGGAHSLVNNGLISADVAGGTLNLAPPGGTITNNATLQAQNGGTLLLSSDVINNPGGQIVAGAGSSVRQNGVRISGTINTSGSGSFSAISSISNILDGVTLNGTLDLTSVANSRERVANGITFAPGSVINVANGGILLLDSSLTTGGNQTIGGTGIINLNDAGARITLEGNGQTTIGAGVTVRGQGAINNAIIVGGTNSLVNNGLISADVNATTLNLNPSGTITNNGTLQAQNGGTLILSSDVIGNAAGQIVAGAGSTVRQNSVRISGVINTSGAGSFAAISSFSNILDAVTLNGTLDLTSIANSRERIANGLTLNGAVNVANGGILILDSSLTAGGNQTIGGTGTINLNNSAARITLEGAGQTTIGTGVTVRGQGAINNAIIVGGTNNLVNSGAIVADAIGGTLVIAPSGSFTNNGLVHALNGTLNLTGQQVLGTGTLQISATGVMNLANGTNTQGTLAMGATGAALALGTGNLTLNTDYTNAGAGTGNAFNRRAGVTGTGQIVSGGNAAQAITGANVTNGNTTNATLTLGNMRVGATTYNYQVANTGITGPSLRGAIQTNVNGGNLTDARLTGAGVTASNYNTGAPGSNTGNLGVTFTAATAGALAPLSGQVLNLRSNFENIADQKLNIVLGSGAAAYNAAVGSAVSPVTIVNQRIGGTASAALNVSNTASAGAFSEDLNASVTSVGGNASASGSIAGRLAGTNNTGAGAINVAVATGSEGAKTGAVQLAYQTAGAVNGVSNGLGTASVGSETVTVNGNVYKAATGSIQSAPLNFGTVQVGQVVNQNLVIRNTATGAAGFVEDLNASFGSSSGTGAGLISGSGSLSGILAGNNSNAGNGSMLVTVNTAAAGTVNGNIAVNYATAGAVAGASNGLGTASAGSEAYGVNGVINAIANVINQASPQIMNNSFNLGNVRVGAVSPIGFASVTNVATVAPQAALNASIGGATAGLTASGSFNLLAPGANNNTSLQVGMDTATSGNKAGTAVISFVSDASNVGGCAPNCQLNLAPQNFTVSGAVYQAAIGAIQSAPLNFGTVQVGQSVSQSLVIRNTATGAAGFVEDLNASFGSASGTGAGLISGSGSMSGILAGTNSTGSNGTMTVSVNTGAAGTVNGNIAVNYQTAGAVANISNGLGTAAAGSEAYGVNGVINAIANVINQASPLVNNPTINLGAVRVGAAAPSATVSVTNVATVAPQAALNATIASNGAPVTASGSFNLLNPGATNTTNLQVGLNTATAGNFTGGNAGSATISFVSDASNVGNCAPNCQLTLASQLVSVAGKVYTAAVGQLNTLAVDFGIVRVGDSVAARNIGVQNTAGVSALNDNLQANLNGVGGPFTGSNTVNGVGAGGSGNIALGLNTGSAGIFNQNGAVSFLSYNADMADISAGADGQVSVTAQVNNYANAAFTLFAGLGTLTQNGDNWLLDLGNVTINSSSTRTIRLTNNVAGPADTLGGLFALIDNNDFGLTGFGPVSGLGAGQSSGNLDLSFDALALGLFQDVIDFDGFGTNASDPLGVAQHRRLTILANVVDNNGNEIPEPGTLALLLLAVAGAVLARRRRIMAH